MRALQGLKKTPKGTKEYRKSKMTIYNQKTKSQAWFVITKFNVQLLRFQHSIYLQPSKTGQRRIEMVNCFIIRSDKNETIDVSSIQYRILYSVFHDPSRYYLLSTRNSYHSSFRTIFRLFNHSDYCIEEQFASYQSDQWFWMFFLNLPWKKNPTCAIIVIAERPHGNGGHTNRVRSGRKQH